MRCQSCNHTNHPGRRFCTECGSALVTVCGACGAKIEPGEKFCGGCGARLGTSAPTGTPASAEVAFPSGERRQLTVLFCDLVASTPLSPQLDGEEWGDVGGPSPPVGPSP